MPGGSSDEGAASVMARFLGEALRPKTPEEVRRRARADRFGNALLAGGGLWHTTHPDRYQAILQTGAILPEPPIPDSERWYAAKGVENGPYVRKLGGVSLFDFRGFPGWEAFHERYPACSLPYFVPAHSGWGQAVWVEIDRATVQAAVLSPGDVLARQKREGCLRNMVMPGVEAAHIGPLPRSSFRRAFHVDARFGSVRREAV